MTESECTLSVANQAIKDVLLNSKKFLKIVTFRFDSQEFTNLIIEKAKHGVHVEVITNPSDNVAKDEMRPHVEAMYKELRDSNVILKICKWEAGEPRLTTTSMSGHQSAGGIGEKWYSLHFQLFINETTVVVTSRPLTDDKTIDIFYKTKEPEFLAKALRTYERINKLFFEPTKVDSLSIPGIAVTYLDSKMLEETIDLFKSTGRLNAKYYLKEKLPKTQLLKGLAISPFDGKMRDFLYEFIDSADNYIYFFLETFFDEELIGKLQEKIQSKPDIRINVITCPPERIRQNPQKAKQLINQALSLGVNIGNLPNVQAKFWVSDKWLAISSGDFNRMNLGHATSSNHWKADTQLIVIEDKQTLINQMKKNFESNFIRIDEGKICSKEVIVLLKRMTKSNNLTGSSDAYKYLSRFKAELMIKTEQDVRYVLENAVSLAKMDDKSRLEGVYILMAIVIYHIQRREHRLEEIVEKLDRIENKPQIEKIMSFMERRGQLVKVGEFYRIAPNLVSSHSRTQTSLSKF